MNKGLSIKKGFLWIFIWFFFMILYNIIDIVIWRKIVPDYSRILNTTTVILCTVSYFILLERKTHFKAKVFANISHYGALLAIASSVLFYTFSYNINRRYYIILYFVR